MLSTMTVLNAYFDKITDGTLRIAHDLYDADRLRLDHLCTTTRTGFLQIKNTDLATRSAEDLKAIVADDAHWEHFHHARLDPCFAEDVDLSPTGTLNAGFRTDHMTPEIVIRLALGRIETRFPGGAKNEDGSEDDLGDQDLRDLISAKNLVIHANHQWLHTQRRENVEKLYRHAVVFAAVAVAWIATTTLWGNPLSGHSWPVIATLPAAGLMIMAVAAFHVRSVFIRRRHRALADQFNAATRLSCATVAKCAILRQDNLIHAGHVIFELTNSGKEDYWAEGRLKRWAEVNEKWCELLFWLNGRLSANADFAFLRAKLIGMTLEGLAAKARFEALRLSLVWLIALAALTGIDLALVVTGLMSQSLPVEALAFLAYAGWMAFQMLRLHGLIRGFDAPEAIGEILTSDSLQRMKGYRDGQLHAEMAHFMKREKLKQLYAERTRVHSGVTQDLGLV